MPPEVFAQVIENFQIWEPHYFDPVHSIKLLSTFIPISQNDLRIKTKLGQVDNNIKYNNIKDYIICRNNLEIKIFCLVIT